MKLASTFAVVAACNALSLDFVKKSTDTSVEGNDHQIPPGVLHLEFSASRGDLPPTPRYAPLSIPRNGRLMKRDGSYAQVTLNNQFTYYEIEVEIGTPSQKFGQIIDTGSSDLWVSSSNNPYCASNRRDMTDDQIICNSGTFNYNDSSTWLFNASSNSSTTDPAKANVAFQIQYQDNTFASGIWGTDVVKFGNVTLKNCSVGVGLEANSSQGVFGIGLPAIESTNTDLTPPGRDSAPALNNEGGRSNNQQSASDTKQKAFMYKNIPQLMKQEGITQAAAYSLWLNDVNADKGNILFGGVDHAKYNGTLSTVPLISSSNSGTKPSEMQVMLNGITVQGGGSKANNQTIMKANVPALLDSGTTFTYLPTSIVQQIARSLGAQISAQLGYYICSCSVGEDGAALYYNFSGTQIKVPLSQVLFELADSSGNAATFDDGNKACALGILPSRFIVLGDSFLRSAYVVYNLDKLEISIANTKFNASDSNIEAINSKGVPSATKAQGYSSTKIQSSITVSKATRIAGVQTEGPLGTNAESDGFITSTTTTTAESSGNAAATAAPMPRPLIAGVLLGAALL